MNTSIRSIFLILALLIFNIPLTPYSYSQEATDLMKKVAIQDLSHYASLYKTMYAPYTWKQQYRGLDMDKVLAERVKEIQESKDLTKQQLWKIIKKFFLATQDYHVSVRFDSSESATLPLTIRSAQGRYFIVYVDREKLPQSTFPYDVGTEVLAINNVPVEDVVQSIYKETKKGVKETDLALAEIFLTRRRASMAMTVPQGAAIFTLQKSDNDRPVRHQLTWEYTPDHLEDDLVTSDYQSFSIHSLATHLKRPHHKFLISPDMQEHLDHNNSQPNINPHGIGTNESFVPRLGKIIWQAPSRKMVEVSYAGLTSKVEEPNFDAYIYENAEGKRIGVLRIPSYYAPFMAILSGLASQKFKETIKLFEFMTDAMVIDQVNNPGGSLLYIYSLVSYLSPDSMYIPRQREAISQDSVIESLFYKEFLPTIKNNEEATKAMGSHIHGYPVDYQLIQSFLYHNNYTLSEWKKGHHLTTSHYFIGIDRVNPDKEANYTKPILILVNELDFSGGDYFPTIMQDNKRATIMGTRTSGAGGYVLAHTENNIYGLKLFSMTGSIGRRIDNNPIEDLGVTPDISYKLTINDLRNGYGDYKKAINSAVSDLLKE